MAKKNQTQNQTQKIDWQSLPGWFDYESIYDEWAANVPPTGVIIEAGVFCGRSLGYLCQKLIDLGKTNVKVYGIDIFDQTIKESDLIKNNPTVQGLVLPFYTKEKVEKALAGYPNLAIIKGNAATVLITFQNFVDYIWIDANHTYDYVSEDLAAAYMAANDTGVIGGHDYCEKTHPQVFKAFNDFINAVGTKIETQKVIVGSDKMPSITFKLKK